MTKLKLQISVLVFLLSISHAFSQANYFFHIRCEDKDSSLLYNELGIQNSFATRFACVDYINRLPALLQSKGYVTASIDSLVYDSTFANIVLFVGEKYLWADLDARHIDAVVLNAIGWRENLFKDKPMSFGQVQLWEERILNYFENNGYPFAKVYMDSLQLDNEKVTAIIKADSGPLYKIDSIRVFGEVKISNQFLQRYLDIANGSNYSKQKLQRVSKKILELPYVEEEKSSDISRLVTGAVLNLYLKQKKSSQINVLLGFLPNNDQLSSKKLLVTGEANINLRNALGAGETIGLNWQQIQVQSPRLNIIYRQPFVFKSPVGIDFAFDFFRKDTTFLNVKLQLGAQYMLNVNQSGKLFFQKFQTIINGVNKNFVLQNRKLPDEGDVSSSNLGVDYEFNNTDYRFNPRRGYDVRVTTSIGSRKIKKNNEILALKDPANPSFDFGKLYDTIKLNTHLLRVTTTAARYIPLGRQSTIKTALNGGFLQSGNIFKNELFQVGGYKLLRGFDEESQYLSQYFIGTVEYRYLVDQNSFFYALMDGGWGRNNSQNNKINYGYFGTGLGIAFETRAGVFNLAWAIGKRSDTQFNLRQSKIHFGFVSYF